MCLAVPMQIVAIEGLDAIGNADGIRRKINLFLLSDQLISVGDWVLVHVGYAIQKLDPERAQHDMNLFRRMGKTNA